MKEINKEEMKKVEGGTDTITASMVTAIYRTINLIYTIGEALGSYVRRKTEDKMCNI